ncbi:MAG: methyltransferase [Rhodothermaceae bacterium]
MKLLPNLDYNFKEYMDLLVEPVKTSLLLNSIKYKVFDHLKNFETPETITEILGTHLINTTHFLNALASCEFIIKKDGKYKNSPKADLYLVSDSEYYLGEAITFNYEWYRPAVENLPQLVEKGPESYSDLKSESDELWKNVTRIFEKFQKTGTAKQFAEKIVKLPEFGNFKKMLDLGCSAGLIGMSITAEHPEMKCVLLDKPMVAETTKKIVAEHNMTNRVEVMGADYLSEPIGEGYDLIIASATLYFAKNNISEVTKKIFEALNPGGIFVSYHEGFFNEDTQPVNLVLSWMGSMLTGQNISYSKGELASEMLKAGFSSVHSETTRDIFGDMEFEVARKL